MSELVREPRKLTHREQFTLALVIVTTLAFLFVAKGYLIAALLGAIAGTLLRPIFLWVSARLGGRPLTAASLVLIASIITLGLPAITLLILVAAEAIQFGESLLTDAGLFLQQTAEGRQLVPDWLPFSEQLQQFQAEIRAGIANGLQNLTTLLVRGLRGAMEGVVGLVLQLFVMFYSLFFFLLHGPAVSRKMAALLPIEESDYDKIVAKSLAVTKATLVTLLIIGLVQGTLVGLALAVAGFEGAIFWGAVAVVMSAVPFVGASVVWMPAGLYLIVTGDTTAGILVILWGALVVATVDNLMRPKLIGDSATLPSLVVLLSILGGLSAFGPIGILVGPLLAGFWLTTVDIYDHVFGLPAIPTLAGGKETDAR